MFAVEDLVVLVHPPVTVAKVSCPVNVNEPLSVVDV
jgi:hypothetical protein